jgi:hypothetical protein
MGTKAKIVAVSIDKEEEVAPQVDEEVKTEAQLMTEIINEVNAPEGLCSVQDEEVPVIEDQGETPVVVAKAKAKRVSKAKPIVTTAPVEPEVVDAEVVEPVAVDAIEPVVVEPKVDAKVACPDCGKQMSAKTLKYSHGPNCSSKKQKQGDEEESTGTGIVRNPLTEAILDNWKETRCTRAARAVRRQEMVDRLIQNAF